MSGDLRLSSLQRESVAPRAASAADHSAALAIDDKTFWTGGKEYQLDVTNQHPFRRWYRVLVTNLKSIEEYCVYYRVIRADRAMEETFSRYSQFDALSNEDMIEVAQGEVLQFWLVLGGDANLDATSVRTFEVVVQEFAVPEDRALQGEIWREALRWIPRPNLQQVELKVSPNKIKQAPGFLAKLLPWRRTKPCLLQLDNYSSLPVTASFNVDPSEENKEIGVAGIHSSMQQPLPPGQRHREECHVLITEALKKPVFLDVGAKVRLATDTTTENFARPKAIEIIPIPLLRCWEPYVFAISAFFLLFWALFGMPPWVEPKTEVVLNLDKLPDTVKASDLDVSLKLRGNDAPLAERRSYSAVRAGNKLTYKFDWDKQFTGPRWAWGKPYDIELNVKPKHDNDPAFNYYVLGSQPLEGRYSVSQLLPAATEIKYPYRSRLASVTIPASEPPIPFKYDLLDENSKSISSGTSDGQSRFVQVDVPSEERTVHLNITAKNKLAYSNDLVLKPKDHMEAKWAVKDDAPAGGPGGTAGPIVPLTVGGVPGGPGGVPPGGTGGTLGPLPIGGPPGGRQTDPGGHQNLPGGHQNGPDKTPAGLSQDRVEQWCAKLGILGSAVGLVAGSKDPGALKLTRLSVVPEEGKDFKLVITPSADSYVQAYEIYPGADAHPVFGVDLKTHMSMSPGSPGAVARPIMLPGNKPFELDLQADGPTARIIVIAYRTDQEPTADLVELLGQKASEPSLKDWTIGQVVYNVK